MELRGTLRQLPFSRDVVLPTYRCVIVPNVLHRDAALDRTHRRAEITPDARLLDDLDDGAPIGAG
jgi:hypothetical protein